MYVLNYVAHTMWRLTLL